MLIALLNDSHFGARNDSDVFMDYFGIFYSDVFFPKLDELGIKHIIHLGDLFDRRKFVNYKTLHRTNEVFLAPMLERGISLDVIPGNHDLYFKNTLSVNSPELSLGKLPGTNVFTTPTVVKYDDLSVGLVPWLCTDNYMDAMEFLNKAPVSIIMGHFEVQGFEMYRGTVNTHGLPANVFDRFDMVLSGHFHHRSKKGPIHYLGAQYQMTWSDWDDERGFHIIDTETQQLTYYENPHKMFHKVIYDDTSRTYSNQACDMYEGTILKVVVAKKTDPYEFEKFLDRLYASNIHDLTILEDLTSFQETNVSDEITQQADKTTLEILSEYVDSVETDKDKDRIKRMMNEIYHESLFHE